MKLVEEQIILVTGATDGLGKGVAFDLAKRGATVLVHGRDTGRIEANARRHPEEHRVILAVAVTGRTSRRSRKFESSRPTSSNERSASTSSSTTPASGRRCPAAERAT